MKRLTGYLTIAVLGIVYLTGCAIGKGSYILSKSRSGKSDVFDEVIGKGTLPKGYAYLVIKATIKTHLEGYYLLESKESPHGRPTYPFLFNISGQAVTWNAEGRIESKPKYEGSKISRDSDAGEGMKYILEKKILIKPGSHKIFYGLPAEDYLKEFEISLAEGESYILEFKPIYRDRARFTRIPTFMKEIKGYEVFLNEKEI